MHDKPVRYQNQGCLHFITFSCYRRTKLLNSAAAQDTFERELERVRLWYGCFIPGYVVMPEHVHLLISEPERGKLSLVIQMLKQLTSRKLKPTAGPPDDNVGRVCPEQAKRVEGAGQLERFWQVRYYGGWPTQA